MTLPDLADRVAEDIYVKWLSLSAGASRSPSKTARSIGRRRGEVRKLLAEAVA